MANGHERVETVPGRLGVVGGEELLIGDGHDELLRVPVIELYRIWAGALTVALEAPA